MHKNWREEAVKQYAAPEPGDPDSDAYKKWRDEVFRQGGYNQRLALSAKENRALEEENKRLHDQAIHDKDRYEDRIKKLEDECDGLIAKVNGKDRENLLLQGDLRKYVAQTKAVQQTLEELRVEAENARAELQKVVADRQNVMNDLVAATDKAGALELERQRLERCRPNWFSKSPR